MLIFLFFLGPQNNSKQMTEAAVVTCVKLCKASTYLNIADSGNVTFILVKSVITDLKVSCGRFLRKAGGYDRVSLLFRSS